MEASALHAPASLSRLPLASPLLRLRSDDQLVALFRAGSDDAFRVLHDRYRQRLFAYVRQMLSSHSRQDAEDVLQDVFVRAFGALRGDQREVNVRAWLYRVAHNRCIDQLRRPTPPPAEIFEMSRKPLHDPVDEAQRRDDLRRLVADVGRLPEQQRSALLMREIDGMSYADLAAALDVTVPAVKSLLVRARVGLVEAQEAREADCGEIRSDLHASYDRGVKASARARRHMRECSCCREYRQALRGVRRSFAALVPSAGPVALAAKVLGLGGAGGGGVAAAGSAGAGGSIVVVGGATAACKVAAVVCATAITAGGAVEMQRLAHLHRGENDRPRSERRVAQPAPVAPAPRSSEHAVHRPAVTPSPAAAALRARAPARRAAEQSAAAAATAAAQPEPAVHRPAVTPSPAAAALRARAPARRAAEQSAAAATAAARPEPAVAITAPPPTPVPVVVPEENPSWGGPVTDTPPAVTDAGGTAAPDPVAAAPDAEAPAAATEPASAELPGAAPAETAAADPAAPADETAAGGDAAPVGVEAETATAASPPAAE